MAEEQKEDIQELYDTTAMVIRVLEKQYNENQHKLTIDNLTLLWQCAYLAMFQFKDVNFALKTSWKLKWFINKALSTTRYKDIWGLEGHFEDKRGEVDIVKLYYDTLKLESFHLLESFVFYMEKKRKQAKRYYLPRKKTLHVVIQDLQDLENGKYKFYGLSLPPRTAKSTTCIFFLAWIMLKKPNSHSAMCGHSGTLAKGFFKELINLLTTEEYTFKEIYEYWNPAKTLLENKSAEDFTINLDLPDRFATFTARGIDGTWTGAVDITGNQGNSGYLYIDDLVRDREHSLSPQRMENTYNEMLNKCFDRLNGDFAKVLMVGTLWNVLDPLERMRKQYEDNPQYKFKRIPALNENDESNFDYDFGMGFSTAYYKDMRERLDPADWQAKYQQKPYVREGILYEPEQLRYFNGILPDGDCRHVAAVDVAYGGGDSLSMPIGVEFENGDVYIVDWVFSKGTKEETIPIVVGKIIENEIRQITFEGNQGGDMYCQYVDDELKKRGYKCSCRSKKAPNTMAKLEKIMAYSGDIKRKFVFLTSQRQSVQENEKDAKLGVKRAKRNQDYQRAMDELTTFVTIGKNDHDDSADSLTQLAMEVEGRNNMATVTAIQNPFRGNW